MAVAPDTILRLAEARDVEAVSNLVRTRSAALGYGTDEEFDPWFQRNYGSEAMTSKLEQPMMTCLVVIESNALIGYAHVNLQTTEPGGLHVAKDSQRVGTLLTEALLEIARTSGLERVILTVAEHNSRVIRQVLRYGFSYCSCVTENPPSFESTTFHRYEKLLSPSPVDEPTRF